MDLIIHSKKIKGNINIPSSKSVSHRAIICACLAKGTSIIQNVNLCEDVKNTINIMREIVPIKLDGNTLTINGGIPFEQTREITVYESATTLRLLLPVLTLYTEKLIVNTGEKLYKRDIKELEKIYKQNNKQIIKKNKQFILEKLPIEKTYKIDCSKSSQCASGMLISSPNLGQKTIIEPIGTASKKYLDLTIEIMGIFGIKIERKTSNLVIDNQEYKPTTFCVPDDASFKLNIDVINSLGSKILESNKTPKPIDPDQELSNLILENKLLKKKEVDLKNNPDAIFAVSLYFLFNQKSVKLLNVKRIENKESKRLTVNKTLVSVFGGKQKESGDDIIIDSPIKINKNKKLIIDSFNDHRVVLASLIISTFMKKDIIIKKYDAVYKSVPNLLEILKDANFDFETAKNETIEYKIKNNEETIKINFTDNIFKALKQSTNKKQKIIIITDKNTPKEFLNENKNNPIYYVETAGESAKQLYEVEKLTKYLLEKEVSKSDCLVAYGGGTITDLVGFVASTYKRGIKHINIPTTLIGQADAAIGGKTAINIDDKKNQIGTFSFPKTTIIDTGLLKTLPEKELKSGMAEIIKIAATSNPKLFYSIYDSKPYEHLDEWIKEAVKTKAKIVSEDYLEKSKRRILNFGHTYGHALELKENISHGEAIAKGMVIVSPIKELKDVIMSYKFDFPTAKEQKEAEELIKHDKKIKNNKLSLIKLEKIGKTSIEEINIWFLKAKK